jgi:Zn-dependent M16 (insulinase) family peptidase
MNIVKTIDQYNENYVYFCEPIKNNIMNEGNFIRILYSTPLFVLNGIYVSVNIGHLAIEKYYNKFKCTFDTNQHKEIVDKLRVVEEGILKKVNINGKLPQHKIYEQLKNGNIKVFSETFEKINNTFLLKIAGIWETEHEYGLTYKFINIHP